MLGYTTLPRKLDPTQRSIQGHTEHRHKNQPIYYYHQGKRKGPPKRASWSGEDINGDAPYQQIDS